MKRIRIFMLTIAAMMSGVIVSAEQRSKEAMDEVARNFFKAEGYAKSRPSVAMSENAQPVVIAKSSDYLQVRGGQESFYVYANGNDSPGFVIVSADADKPEILGFSYNERFASEKMSPEVEMMLRSYASRQSGRIIVPAATVTRAGELLIVSPLLGDINFNQDEPYNSLGPRVYVGECDGETNFTMPTGCVATAAAQIMAYYKYPARMNDKPLSYTSGSYLIPITWDCASTVFDWNNVLPDYGTSILEQDGNVEFGEDLPVARLQLDGYDTKQISVSMSNHLTTDFAYRHQLWVAKEDGELICPVGSVDGWTLDKNTGTTHGFKHYFPKNLPDGSYRFYVCAQVMGEGDMWHRCSGRITNGIQEQNNYLDVQKRGDKYIIGDKEFDCYGLYSAEQKNEVAKLHAAIGAAIKMDYTPSESGAYPNELRDAFVNYFSYDKDLHIVFRQGLSEAQVHHCLQDELKASRPVFLAGGGHAFVLDGCDVINNTTYYHINWGWGGSYNGYYLVDYLTPSGSGIGGNSIGQYSEGLLFIIGIQPENGIADTYEF